MGITDVGARKEPRGYCQRKIAAWRPEEVQGDQTGGRGGVATEMGKVYAERGWFAGSLVPVMVVTRQTVRLFSAL